MECVKSGLFVGHFIESKARQTAQAVALRARIVLGCAEGLDNKTVAVRQRVTPQTVSQWQARFVEHCLNGLLGAPRPGAPRSIEDARVDAMIARTLRVQSRHLMDRTDDESIWLWSPASAAVFIGRQPAQGFQPPGEVICVDEVLKMLP